MDDPGNGGLQTVFDDVENMYNNYFPNADGKV